MELRGWDRADIILFSADAYVDHPAFGAAVIGRMLERAGFRNCRVRSQSFGIAQIYTGER